MSEKEQLPFVTATPQHRLGGKAIDLAFYAVTFGIGWLIWNFIVWSDGRTPGHQVLSMRVYSTDTGRPARWGHMALRQFVIPFTYCLVPLMFIIFGGIQTANLNTSGVILMDVGYFLGLLVVLLDIFWIFKGDKRQRLVDVFAKTTVLNECISSEIHSNGSL